MRTPSVPTMPPRSRHREKLLSEPAEDALADTGAWLRQKERRSITRRIVPWVGLLIIVSVIGWLLGR
jgi:hypothetical protein